MRSSRAPRAATALLAPLVLGAPLVPATAQTQLPDTTVVALVGDRPIVAADLLAVYESGAVGVSGPTDTVKRDILDRLVRTELLAAEAERRGHGREPGVAGYVREKARGVAAEELRRRIYGGKISVSEDEIRELYERYFYTFRARHLNVETRESAEELRARILAGEDFGELARHHSGDPQTAPKGGELNETTAGRLFIKFEDLLFTLEPGEVSPVIKGKGENYKVFKLESMTRDRQPPHGLEELRPALEKRVRDRESGVALVAWQNALLEKYGFEIDEAGYERYADLLRDRIEEWEIVYSLDPDSLSDRWIFSNWDLEKQDIEIARFHGGRVTSGDFNIHARNLEVCPTCLWRDSDVQLRKYIEGLAFDRMVETELTSILKEDIPWIDRELERRRRHRLSLYLVATLQIDPDTVPAEVAREYIEAHPEEFVLAPQVKFRRILVESEAQAQDIWNRLEGGADFGALVERFSIDTETRPRAGESPYLKPGAWKGVADAALKGEPGELLRPFKSAWGWEIVQVLDKVARRPATFEQAAETARGKVAHERSEAVVGALLDSLRASTPVVVREDVLASLALGPS